MPPIYWEVNGQHEYILSLKNSILLATLLSQAQRTHINMFSLYKDLLKSRLNTRKPQVGEKPHKIQKDQVSYLASLQQEAAGAAIQWSKSLDFPPVISDWISSLQLTAAEQGWANVGWLTSQVSGVYCPYSYNMPTCINYSTCAEQLFLTFIIELKRR